MFSTQQILINFGSSKSELNLKYRLGLEHALARADFLNTPNIVLVQAFAIFLVLLRRHDSPRFVWMMTGVVIRMAQGLGLHRDGSHFAHLTPFEIEMRRRTWWAVCELDVRASEDQGTDLTIAYGSFDTRLPLNIDDADISPETREPLVEREGITDMTLALVACGFCEVTRQIMAIGNRDETPASLDAQSRLLGEVYDRLERRYLRYADAPADSTVSWVVVMIVRLVVAKLTLITHLPTLFSAPSPSEHFSEEMRAKLFVAAIEVAEYNHALNAERACRQWRWIFQVSVWILLVPIMAFSNGSLVSA